MSLSDYSFVIKGAGHVNESGSNPDFSDYTKLSCVPVQLAPQKFIASVHSGKTVYDVSASFNTEGKQTLLRQFKNIILS